MTTLMESCCSDPKSTISDDHRFEGKTIVITGAGGQFGRAGCLYFGKRGARVAGLDKSVETLKGTLDEMNEQLGLGTFDFVAYDCDITDAAAVSTVVESIASRFGKIDLLWNNAGYQGQIQQCLEYDPVDFALVMNINVTGMFIVLQAVAKQMAKQAIPGLSIVNTASVAGMRGTPGMIAYSSSKAAVIAMTIAAAKDLARYQIRVNSISPALIGPGFMWDRQNQLHAELGPPYFPDTPEKVAEAKLSGVPLKRLGSVDEVLQTVAFLLSSESSYTTGTNLVVDGGLAAGLK